MKFFRFFEFVRFLLNIVLTIKGISANFLFASGDSIFGDLPISRKRANLQKKVRKNRKALDNDGTIW